MFPLNWHDERTGESYVGYRESGFFPEAFTNMLSLLGWNPGTAQEIFTMEDLIQQFSIERVSKSGARFDPEKTKWFNQQYLRMKTDAELAKLFAPQLSEELIKHGINMPDEAQLEVFCKLMKEKAHFVHEFWGLGSFFFVMPEKYDEGVIQKRWNAAAKGFFEALHKDLESASDFDAVSLEKQFKDTAEKMNIAPGQVMQLFRVLVSGVGGGPALFEMMEWMGKDSVLARFEKALNTLPTV
jgi:glutamyl-tRNA synthetase